MTSTYNGILLSNKKKSTTDPCKTWKNIRVTMLHGRNQTKKEYILNESHSTKFYKRQRNQTSSFLRMGRVGLGGGGGVGSKHSQVGFPGGASGKEPAGQCRRCQ